MNIVILGNTKSATVSEKINAIASTLVAAGINVRYPTADALDTSEDLNFQETFGRIDWADIVLAIPKEGLSFGYSTMSEVAYAKHVKKPVFVYYE